MCGIAGFWETDFPSGTLVRQSAAMVDTLAHRGPDDAGVWVEATEGLGMGFRRLAVVDLSPDGHQPMTSENDRFTITYNGEVYNFVELRDRLASLGHRFRGHSDTEVILAAIEAWGLETAISRFVGMFAFALWDHDRGTLSLVRDRLGIKPLYYGWAGRTFLWTSELKALHAHPAFQPEVDRGALTLYLRHNYVPAPYTMYCGISKLPPGCVLTIPSPESRPSPIPYWSAREIAEQGMAERFAGSDENAIASLDAVLRDSVKLQMVADVPLGAFLSGGIDSSTVVALMQAQSNQATKTFSIGFHDQAFNEAHHAALVARHLETDHTELYVTASEAQEVIPRLAGIYDEPFGDSSQIPTLLVSELARRSVTVSLSGDGGDELFAGYTRYSRSNTIWKAMSRLPRASRVALARGMTIPSPALYDRVFGVAMSRARLIGSESGLGHRVHAGARVLRSKDREQLYQFVLSHVHDPSAFVIDGHEPANAKPARFQHSPASYLEWMQYFDTVTYLPDDILTKVDRASMAVSLEARVPLLDHRVVELAWRLPVNMKVREGTDKWVLRQVLYQYVPPHLMDRPKMGFGVPLASWLRGPLRDWASALLAPDRLTEQGYFYPNLVHEQWQQHLTGRRNWAPVIWNLLMFQAWLEEWGTARTHQLRRAYHGDVA